MSAESKGKRSSSYYPTQWSDWEWDEESQRRRRYRLRNYDDHEFEFDPPPDASNIRGFTSQAQEDYLPYSSGAWPDQFYTTNPAFSTTPLAEAAEQITKTGHSCTWPSCDLSFSTLQERDRHYQTIHANNGERPHKCFIPGCQAAVRSWAKADKLRAHNKQWHGPYHCPVSGCTRGVPNGFASQMDLDTHQKSDEHAGIPEALSSVGSVPLSMSPPMGMSDIPGLGSSARTSGQLYPPRDLATSLWGLSLRGSSSSAQKASDPCPTLIRTKNTNTSFEKFDRNYKVHHSSDFKFGRVFKVLWAEPKGNSQSGNYDSDDSDLSVREGKYGETHWEKVRRFVIINVKPGHCICLPINTYGKQATLKSGVHASHHTIIYNSHSKPTYLLGEWEKGLTRTPVAFTPDHPRHKLLEWARLNYAKTYTIEHNVKVWFIGQISDHSQRELVSSYNDVHPPLQMPPPSPAVPNPSSPASTGSYVPQYSQYPQLFSDLQGSDTQASTSTPAAGSKFHSSFASDYSSMYSQLGVSGAYDSQDVNYSQLPAPNPQASTPPPATGYNPSIDGFNSYWQP